MRSAEEWLAEHGSGLSKKTEYERRFVENVLSRVEGLDWRAVGTQTGFRDTDGRQRRIDFTISEGSQVRIAIEVDGYDKTGSGRGMTPAEFADASRRDQAMIAAGWRPPIHIANRIVDQHAEQCARTIELVLRRERKVAAALSNGARAGEADALRQQALSQGETIELVQLRDLLQQENERLREEVAQEQQQRAVVEANRDGLRHGNRVAVVAVACAAALGGVGLLAGLMLSGDDDSGDAQASNAALCRDAAPWQQAAASKGIVTARGPVAGAAYAANARGEPTFIDIGGKTPAPDRMRVVVWGENRNRFSTPPDQAYRKGDVAVRGKIGSYKGVPEIVIDGPEDISSC